MNKFASHSNVEAKSVACYNRMMRLFVSDAICNLKIASDHVDDLSSFEVVLVDRCPDE